MSSVLTEELNDQADVPVRFHLILLMPIPETLRVGAHKTLRPLQQLGRGGVRLMQDLFHALILAQRVQPVQQNAQLALSASRVDFLGDQSALCVPPSIGTCLRKSSPT